MITPYLAMQNGIMARNVESGAMVQNCNAMLSSVSFGNSQPLRPSFAQGDVFELQNKANETKISALDKMIESIQKCLKKNIDRSTPHFGGLNINA